MDALNLKPLEGEALASPKSPIKNPVTIWLNPTLISIDDTRMECEIEVRPEMADPIGILHGGMRATMLCDILGILANHGGQGVSSLTTSVSTECIGKAFVGEKVRVIANTVHKGGTLIYMSGEIRNEKGGLVATGKTTLFSIAAK